VRGTGPAVMRIAPRMTRNGASPIGVAALN
jgi:hypothetical protein